MDIRIALQEKTYSAPCPLGLTLRDFFLSAGAAEVPELLTTDGRVVVAPAYSLAILHQDQCFQAADGGEPVPTLVADDLSCPV